MYIDEYGNKIYYNSKGECHRLNDLAFESQHGNKWWFKEGLCHRINGPAIEHLSGYKAWYLLDKKLEEKEFNSWMLRIQKCI